MKILKQIDNKTRIVVKIYFPALGTVLALQRKYFLGWKTVSWIYPQILESDTKEYVEEWLFWSEKYNRRFRSKRIAEEIFKRNNL